MENFDNREQKNIYFFNISMTKEKEWKLYS